MLWKFGGLVVASFVFLTTPVSGQNDGCASMGQPCHSRATCQTTVAAAAFSGSGAVCLCASGYSGDGFANGSGCTDTDECATGVHTCGSREMCIDTEGSFTCVCNPGYSRAGDGNCYDIDECSTSNYCDNINGVRCDNLDGSFQCVCNNSSKQFNTTTLRCEDMNECTYMGGQRNTCQQECIDTAGSFECQCYDGYEVDPNDETACIDINECAATPNPCRAGAAACTNLDGGYKCECDKTLGEVWDPEVGECVNYNECLNERNICGSSGCCRDLEPGQGPNNKGYECISPVQTRRLQLADALAAASQRQSNQNNVQANVQANVTAGGNDADDDDDVLMAQAVTCPAGYKSSSDWTSLRNSGNLSGALGLISSFFNGSSTTGSTSGSTNGSTNGSTSGTNSSSTSGSSSSSGDPAYAGFYTDDNFWGNVLNTFVSGGVASNTTGTINSGAGSNTNNSNEVQTYGSTLTTYLPQLFQNFGDAGSTSGSWYSFFGTP